MSRIVSLSAAAATVAAMPSMAFAHTGVGSVAGFAAGIAHPFGGIDHLVVMIAVGLYAAQLGGRALWAVPASFVALMSVGGVLGAMAIGLPFVEVMITISVVALVAAVVLRIQLPTLIAAALAGLFAIFHGHAHGAEMPHATEGLSYGLGFIVATAALHGVGIAIGLMRERIAARLSA